MKTRVFLAVALVFSLTVMSCGNKKAAEANSETTEQICDPACTKAAEKCCAGDSACCANDSICKKDCDKACAGDCEEASCPKKACDKACEK